MKRLTFLIATLCMLQMNVNAQTLEKVPNVKGFFRPILPEHTVSGKTKLYYETYNQDRTNVSFVFYGDDFNDVKEIVMSYDEYERIVSSEYYNYDNAACEIDGIPFTETMFNNDEKLEYIRRTDLKDKVEIVNEDGEVLFTVDTSGFKYGPYAKMYRWNHKDYLLLYDEYGTQYLYAINKNENESSISKVKTLPGLSASPVFANRNSVVDVTIDEAAAANGGELVIVDNSGRIVAKQQFEPGQTTVSVQTDRMRTGVYNITFNNGEKIDNARIIVK